MSDPINRKTIYLDDALEAIRKLPNAGIHWLISAEAVFDVLLKLPSAQPEIIRCKDCKHLQKWRSEESAKKFGQIYECRKGVLREPVPDDFCSKAERREE